MSTRYRALVGLDYPPDRRVEPGEVSSDIPAKSVKWLLDAGLIEAVGASGKPTPAPTPEPDPEPTPEDGE